MQDNSSILATRVYFASLYPLRMPSTHISLLVSYMLLLSSSVCNAALTYWIDETCTAPKYGTRVPDGINELVKLCKATDANMGKPLPDHLGVAFQMLFTEVDPETVTTIKGTTS